MAEKNPTFDDLKVFALDYWGLFLQRADKNNRGYWSGCWRTGFVLSGDFPGHGYSWRRFATLKQLAKCLEYESATAKEGT